MSVTHECSFVYQVEPTSALGNVPGSKMWAYYAPCPDCGKTHRDGRRWADLTPEQQRFYLLGIPVDIRAVSLLTAFTQCATLYQVNARHRKGWRLQSLTDDKVLDHTTEEVEELRDAPNDLLELADALATLFDYAARKEWTEHEIGTAIAYKLTERFTVD